MSRDDYTDEVFTSRAVAEDVAAERGYRRYGAGDRGTVLRVDPKLGDPELADWLRAALRDSGGWVLPKCELQPDHPVFGETPYAQLRPDRPVMARPFGHDHAGMRHHHCDEPQVRRRQGRCRCGLTHKVKEPPFKRVLQWPGGKGEHALPPGEAPKVERTWYQKPLRKGRRQHEVSTCDWADVLEDSWINGFVVRKDGEPIVRADGKKLMKTGHLHPDTGEVVVPLKGPHTHLEWAKYLYVKGRDRAKRLSTHPRVRRREYAASEEGLFFFVIEGTLKLDAVVSAGWPGIESGSVTLWNAYGEDELDEYAYGEFQGYDELRGFASRYLQGVAVAVVCDSDWADNWMVREQVDSAVALLADCGVEAVGCAPPPGRYLGWKNPLTDWPVHAKQGVDDFLFWDAERDAPRHPEERHEALLDGLIVREPVVDDAPGLEAAVRAVAGNARGYETPRRLLRDLSRRCTDSGVVPWRSEALEQTTRRKERTLRDTRKKLLDGRHLTLIKEHEHYWSEEAKAMRTRPGLYQLTPELRPPVRKRALRDWLAERR